MQSDPITFVANWNGGSSTGYRVCLLGDFQVRRDDHDIHLSLDAQRVVAFLALRRTAVPRSTVAGSLWVHSNQERACGSLRSAVWRIHRATPRLVEAAGPASLRLSGNVEVDVDLLADHRAPQDLLDDDCRLRSSWGDLALSREFLAGWSDEWVLVERERLRQRCLHLLEELSDRLTAEAHYSAALEAALAAVRLDDLRESAHRCVIRAHLAEGNYSEALRHFADYRSLLRRELSIEPSPQLPALFRSYDLTPAASSVSSTLPARAQPRLKMGGDIAAARNQRLEGADQWL